MTRAPQKQPAARRTVRKKKGDPKFTAFWAWMHCTGDVDQYLARNSEYLCIEAARAQGFLVGTQGRPVRVKMRLARKGER